MGTLAQIIEIYARRRADDVANDPEFRTLCEAKDADKVFHHERHRVEKLKRGLEATVDIQQTRQKQVKYALKFYQRLTGSENQEDEICLQLARKAYFPDWTGKQQAYFEATIMQIKTGQDYFLSFTQRNQGGAGNPINSVHRYLIQSVGLVDPKDSAKNELAQMLHNFLRTSRYQFRGFFFPAHEDNSAQVREKIEVALKGSLVFIQLVQNEMFSKHYAGKPNFCFEEYSRAVKLQKEMVYLFADGQHPNDLILEDDADYVLDPWYQHILGADCVDLLPTLTADQAANITTNRTKLKDRVVEKVQSIRDARWEGVPPDLG